MVESDQEFGSWKVIGRDSNNRRNAICLCMKCDTEHTVSIANLESNKTRRCRNCAALAKNGSGNHQWKGVGRVPSRYFSWTKKNAIKSGKDFLISIEDMAEQFDAGRP